jgi:hypothetical protein
MLFNKEQQKITFAPCYSQGVFLISQDRKFCGEREARRTGFPAKELNTRPAKSGATREYTKKTNPPKSRIRPLGQVRFFDGGESRADILPANK